MVFAGYMKATSGKFSVNYDRGILIPTNPSINVKYVLEPKLRQLAVGRRDAAGNNEFIKIYLSTIQQDILVPITDNGDLSAKLQTELIAEYEPQRESRIIQL